jgi:aminoglycoside phosphotransferase family enzyme/predicted kinase
MANVANNNRLYKLIQAIQNQKNFDHPIDQFEIVETHISYILLTGPYAYKFKKNLCLDFLDFSSLEQRKFYCNEEVRLNRQMTSDLYLGVVSITGNDQDPVINGEGPAIEYAVKMVQFAKGTELDQVLNTTGLTTYHIDELAKQLAVFHGSIETRPTQDYFGSPECIQKQIMANFEVIRPLIQGIYPYQKLLDQIEAWMINALKLQTEIIKKRKQSGYVRECHGDLHLGNIAMHNGKLVIFDCIEFSEELRWIDVISETAFLTMDLDAHGKHTLAQRFLNSYLQITGDYDGLMVLRIYLVYHALIRSKVACIRLNQTDTKQSEREQAIDDCLRYLDLAYVYINPDNIILFITHGLSGSGKTTQTHSLAENLRAIRIRSDVERKRMRGLQSNATTGTAVASGIYSEESTLNTYRRLGELTKLILASGYSVIVDATFLHKPQRLYFKHMACESHVPFIILDLLANEEVLRDRIKTRQLNGNDISEANQDVLNYQIAVQEPLDKTEMVDRITIDSTHEPNIPFILNQINDKILSNN